MHGRLRYGQAGGKPGRRVDPPVKGAGGCDRHVEQVQAAACHRPAPGPHGGLVKAHQRLEESPPVWLVGQLDRVGVAGSVQDQEERAVARSERAVEQLLAGLGRRYLERDVPDRHAARGVKQGQPYLPGRLIGIRARVGLHLEGRKADALDVHGVEQLVPHAVPVRRARGLGRGGRRRGGGGGGEQDCDGGQCGRGRCAHATDPPRRRRLSCPPTSSSLQPARAARRPARRPACQC